MKYDSLLSSSVVSIPPSGIRRFFDIASTMQGVISLGVGEPDFVTPWNIREASIHSIEHGRTHYTSNRGLPELRELVCEYLSTRYGVHYKADECVVTVGASEALDLAFRALLNPGDEVLIPAPSYVSYAPCVTLARGIPVAVPTYEEDAYALRADVVESLLTDRTKAIVLPYPNNPTGGIMTREQIDAVTRVLARRNVVLLADEIYSELTYGGDHESFARGMEERTILINGFSKAFAMTGWRLGYACGPRPLIDMMVKIHQYTMLCAPIMAQVAGIEALKDALSSDFAQVREMRSAYNRRRLLIYEGFRDMGLPVFEPKGAFYIFPSIEGTGMSSEAFCEALLKTGKVATVPGNAFGEAGEGHIRCSYAASTENIMESLRRIRRFLDSLN